MMATTTTTVARRRFAKSCCSASFHHFVSKKAVNKPMHSLLSLDFLHCPDCSGTPPPLAAAALHHEEEEESPSSSSIIITTQKKGRREEEQEEERSGGAAQELLLPPSELAICNLFSRLPLLDLFRARCVCKPWRDSIASPPFFAPLSLHPDCRRPRLVLDHTSPQGTCLTAFDPDLNRWSLLPPPPVEVWNLVGASGGLFCFLPEGEQVLSPSSRLVVCNPLTKQWRLLPPPGPLSFTPLEHHATVLAMTADPVAGSYRVILLCRITQGCLPLVYDSTTARWEMRPVLPVGRFAFHYQRCNVKLPDTVYFLDAGMTGFLSYNVTSNSSTLKELRFYPRRARGGEDTSLNRPFSRLPVMLTCGSRFFVVTRLTGGEQEQILGRLPIVLHRPVGIVELTSRCHPHPRAGEGWQLLTETPHDLLQEMVKESEGTDFIAASNGCDCIWLILKGSSHMLAFHLVSLKWTLLPGCPMEYYCQPYDVQAHYEPLLWAASV